MTDFGFDRALYTYEAEGFAPIASATRRSASIWPPRHLRRRAGTAVDVDDEGRLIVRDETGDTRVFTGEVSVKGFTGRCNHCRP